MDKQLAEKLKSVTDYLGEIEMITNFRAIEKKLDENDELKAWTKELEVVQKEAVLFQKIDKQQAAALANQRADQLTEKINQHPLVVNYQNQLKDVDDLLHYITKRIEDEVNSINN